MVALQVTKMLATSGVVEVWQDILEIWEIIKAPVIIIGKVITTTADIIANFQVYFVVTSLTACMVVGTVSLVMKMMGFNTMKWVALSAATFLVLMAFL